MSKDRVKFFYFFTQNTFQPFYSLLVGNKKKEKWFCNDKSFEGTEDENDRVLGGILVDARKGSNPISAFLVFPTMDLSPGERKVGETWSKG